MEGQIDAEAVVHHEIFAAYIRAGFTRAEALELIKGLNAVQALWALHHAHNGRTEP